MSSTKPILQKDPPPPGFIWLFPTRFLDTRKAPVEAEARSPEEAKARQLASLARLHAKYPFLKDKASPRYRQFDKYIVEVGQGTYLETAMTHSMWREVLADECAELYGWNNPVP